MQKRRLFHVFILIAMLAMLLVSNVSQSNALSIQGSIQNQVPNKLNLLIMVRASKSINGSFFGNGKAKIAILQDVVESRVKGYSFPSNVDVGIMAYGHLVESSNFDASCAVGNVELVTPFGSPSTINLDKFKSISGKGQSPTAIALQEAGKKITQPDALNAILFIADGGDNCYQDSISEAKKLTEDNSIQIYTIGLKVSTEISSELIDIASSPDKYFNVPRSADTEEKYVEALTTQINFVFGQLIGQISAPSVPTNTAIPPTGTDASIATEIVPTTKPAETLTTPDTPAPTSTPIIVEAPSETKTLSGILIVAVIGLIVILIFGYVYWNSKLKGSNAQIKDEAVQTQTQAINAHKTEPTANGAIKTESVNISSVELDIFLQDAYKAYSSIERSGKYISLSILKEKLSHTYPPFDELLILARKKYPSKIWIEKDSRGQTIVKIVL